jgi:16S rRNA C967 or C1407 C5-methylase (RsmB/RsmF family)
LSKRKNKISGKVYEYLTEVYGESSAQKYLSFVQENPSVYARVNTLKNSSNSLVKKLSERYNIKPDHFDSA